MRFVRAKHGPRSFYAQALDDGSLQVLSDAPWLSGTATGEVLKTTDVVLLAPVTPSKVLCVGRNYAAHAKELGNEVPKEPLLFLKPPSSIIGPAETIVIPAMSERVEHEAELGIVVGKRLKDASVQEALAGIFGATCVNDVTARDLQKKDGQFTRAKGFDTFCPVGPFVVTGLDYTKLEVRGRVNGETRQDGHTRDMVFPVAELIAFMSRVMTLEPGDLISTGTPEGVGALVAGDTVEIEIPQIGVLSNPVR